MWRPTDSPGAYAGSKRRLLSWLRGNNYVPPHEVRVSVFGGLGAELFALPPARIEVYNDRGWDVWNFMSCLRDHPDEMIRRAMHTAYHEAEYEFCWDLLHSQYGDRLDRAWAFGVVANMCHVGADTLLCARSSFGYSARSHGQPAGWARIDVTYGNAARRLRRVQCFRRDWSWVLDRFDSGDAFFTIDPPYLGRRLYALSLTEQDHRRLLARVQTLRGRAMIFHTPHPLYERELRRWRRIDVNFTTAMGTTPRGNRKNRHDECVWLNY